MLDQKWTRPNEVPYPNVWRRFEGKREIDGVKPRFRIQDVTEDLEDEIVEHMSTVFLRDEPMCSSVGIADDPVSLKEFQDMWRDYMKQRVAVVAVVEPETTPYTGRVAGCNLLGVTNRTDKVDINKVSYISSQTGCLLFMGGSPGDVSEVPVTLMKRQKGWRMSCDVGEATEGLESEL